MTRKTISDAVTNISTEYIEKAADYTVAKKARKPVWVKWAAMAACFCFALFASITIVHIISPIKTNLISTDRLSLADSVNSLIEISDIIVVAHADTAGDSIMITNELGNIVSGYTNTILTIDKVIKGNVSKESTIEITEECYTTYWGTVLWTQQGYMPVQTEKQYIFFLKAYPDETPYTGKYYPVDLEFGKYLIPSQFDSETISSLHNDRNTLEIGGATDINKYIEWYNTIMQEYFSEWRD